MMAARISTCGPSACRADHGRAQRFRPPLSLRGSPAKTPALVARAVAPVTNRSSAAQLGRELCSQGLSCVRWLRCRTNPRSAEGESERDQDQRGSRVARGEPQHAAELGAPLRLSQAPPHGRRPPPVRAGRARGAARALLETHNISSAIEVARQRGEGPSSPSRLLDAFDHFDEPAADRVMEESLAVRSVDRTVEEVLLPAHRDGRGPRDPRGRVGAGLPLGHGMALRRPARRARRLPRPGRDLLRLLRAARPRVAARAGARARGAPRRLPLAASLASTSRPSGWPAPCAPWTRPRSCSAAARPRSTCWAGWSTPSARWAPPRRCSSTASRCRSRAITRSPRWARAHRGGRAAQAVRGHRPPRAPGRRGPGRGRAPADNPACPAISLAAYR